MQQTTLAERVQSSLVEECAFLACCSMHGRVLALPGVMVAINPAMPDRSLFNGVTYESAGALQEQYDAIAEAYEAAGVRAWSVRVRLGDAVTPSFLESGGHVRDHDTVAMAALMGDLRLPSVRDMEWEETDDLRIIGAINDAAFGFPSAVFEAAFDRWPNSRWRGYIARVDNLPVSSLLTCDSPDGDCRMSGVATLPQCQGRGLATGLMAAALRAAMSRGMTTTSVQADPSGTHGYARLGYRELGRMPVWERRRSAVE
ncbi:hypothetical protein B1C78_15765 [Thioalkalivibrio denitrificans]|uniref:N-acetyltransferase domain-containing protein n=1 Tax=Thioalkalivibrio denitrificans TaxID=108003 RepID=A0A1V3NAI0_9GAMM|nr:GNAT family N-acetyltransferase [Thioalkalivibrio denitrificans]OOG21973.1 hypothetical protein B1C78_15765 [Thioalkalivibrio denitrificans]